ncbi:sulfurtransferase complex subunit TusB [Halomonas sp. M1]|uniref:sulfurtransferase complex subunit TusB n=1 Tax=Halomonas sp. M1 TaxID=3035470 RepID=UPI002486CDE1|nr:sulfurtransferase complex subunit TusB [Halomonas sp. M1]WFE71866.1 sulfurtransferase complex subunit TusB [Halomonas sp. M1]
MLHILNKAPHSDTAQQMLQAASGYDVLLLIEEAVQAALYPNWDGWHSGVSSIFLLAEDLSARGLHQVAVTNGLPMVEMDEFIVLTEQNEQIVTWY